MRTSCSDNEAFPQFCIDAFQKEKVFNGFRQDLIYTGIVETVGFKDGKEYFDLALNKRPEYINYLKRFSKNDSIGTPVKYQYKYGFLNLKKIHFSPTTLRYINTLADLEVFYSNMDEFNIVEIGAAYGGLCRIISERHKFKSYTIVDIEPSLNLAKKYLSYFDLKNVNFITPEQVLSQDFKPDLLISNYAFSEVNRKWQDIYYSKILGKSLRGFMMCNFYSHTWEKNQFSEQEILDLITNCQAIKDLPTLSLGDIGNKISLIEWGKL